MHERSHILRAWCGLDVDITEQAILSSKPDLILLDCCYAPDGQRLATVGDQALRLWDLDTLQCTAAMPVQRFSTGCSWSPDGELIAASSAGRVVSVWNAAKQHPVTRFLVPKVTSCRFSPDSELLATSSSVMRV